jgi:hypothetical protein
MKPRTKQVVQVQNRTRIVFPDVEDIIENIVEKLFLAETSGRNKCASTVPRVQFLFIV